MPVRVRVLVRVRVFFRDRVNEGVSTHKCAHPKLVFQALSDLRSIIGFTSFSSSPFRTNEDGSERFPLHRPR